MKNKVSVSLKAKGEIAEWLEDKIAMLEKDIKSNCDFYNEDNSREWLMETNAHYEQQIKYLNLLIEKLSAL